MKKLLLGVALVCALSCESNEEPKITITQSTFMAAFESGWLRGQRATLRTHDEKQLDSFWTADSLYITTVLFPNKLSKGGKK